VFFDKYLVYNSTVIDTSIKRHRMFEFCLTLAKPNIHHAAILHQVSQFALHCE